jgi:DNA polymerase-3 subunit beta
MKLSMLQDNLINGLKLVGKTVAKKSTLPVLESVYIGTDSGRVVLQTSNLDTAIQVTLGASVDQDGAICVPYANFNKLVNRLSPERIDMETTTVNTTLHLACGASTASFKGTDAQDFPVVPWIRDDEAFDGPLVIVSANRLMAAIDEVIYAAAKEDTRPVLNAVSFEYANHALTLLASDGNRLAQHQIKELTYDGEFNVLIPLSAITLFKSVFASSSKNADDIFIMVNGTRVSFCVDGMEFLVNTIENIFPDYQKIDFTSTVYMTKVDPITVMRLLERAEIFSTYALITTSKENRILAVSASGDNGTTSGVTDAYLAGDEINSYYTIKYLTEALAKMPDEPVRLTFKESIGQSNRAETDYIIKIQKDREPNSYHLLMPAFIGRK